MKPLFLLLLLLLLLLVPVFFFLCFVGRVASAIAVVSISTVVLAFLNIPRLRIATGKTLGSKCSSSRCSLDSNIPGLIVDDADADADADAHPPHHLVIMVNGIFGSAKDWKFGSEQFKLMFGNKVLVHCSARNYATLTIDGVDKMGNRLAEEVQEIIDVSPGLKKISFVAHSLGGLIARYAIGQLYVLPDSKNSEIHEENENPSKGTIYGLEPMNFITVATPHLGSRGSGQLPLLGGLTFLERVAVLSAHILLGRTGRHLFLTDGNVSQPPLLQRMVTDSAEGKFLSALGAFQRRVAYGNMNNDHMVGWRTATLRRLNEVHEVEGEPIDLKYPHIINVENVPAQMEYTGESALDLIEEEMISGLRNLSWQRVDVNFTSPQKLAAHSTIQVKIYWMHSDGADVIAHIVDNFMT